MLKNGFENPVKQFAEGQIIYTGTNWKLLTLTNHWVSLLETTRWREVEDRLGLGRVESDVYQVAVPALEPNNLITQEHLVTLKTRNQITVLLHALSDPDYYQKGEVIIPDWIKEMYATGVLGLALVSTDVGKRQSIGGRKWDPVRNFYVPQGIKRKKSEAKLISHAKAYLAENFASDPSEPYRIAVDSGMCVAQFVWEQGKGTRQRIFPGVSTVGMKCESNILATEKGRDRAVEWLREKYKDNPRIVERQWSPLAALDNRAGMFKIEDLYEFMTESGKKAKYLCNGKDREEMESDLLAHVEGVPFELFRQVFLTLGNATVEMLETIADKPSSIPRLYPHGMIRKLQL